MDGFDYIGEFICQVIFTHVALATLPPKVRTAIINVTASTLLDMLFCCDGTAAIATRDKPNIGERMFLFSRLVVPTKCRLSRLEEFLRDERCVYPLMELSIPAKIAVIQRILEDFFETAWCEGASRFPVAHAHIVGEGGELF